MLKPHLSSLKAEAPLIHNMVSHVSANDCANFLLALGASPIMAEEKLEMSSLSQVAKGLHLNLGTVTTYRFEAMKEAILAYSRVGLPIVLDPVGIASSPYRLASVKTLLDLAMPRVIRGNYAELMCLAGLATEEKGVDSTLSYDKVKIDIDRLLKTSTLLGSILVLSGEEDLIIGQGKVIKVSNGHPMMARLTGCGCMQSALLAGLLAVGEDDFEACLYGVSLMGVLGERAVKRLDSKMGNLSFKIALFDEAFCAKDEQIIQGARYEKIR